MPLQLLTDALDRAERSDPTDRAAALLHIARVLATFDRAEAERTLERGITLATELPEDQRSIILGEAIPLAAAVSPKRALDLAASVPGIRFREMELIVFRMLDHGHLAEAVDLSRQPGVQHGLPFMAASQAMAYCRNDAENQIRSFAGHGRRSAIALAGAPGVSTRTLPVFSRVTGKCYRYKMHRRSFER
jgi:hypothetical protein